MDGCQPARPSPEAPEPRGSLKRALESLWELIQDAKRLVEETRRLTDETDNIRRASEQAHWRERHEGR